MAWHPQGESSQKACPLRALLGLLSQHSPVAASCDPHNMLQPTVNTYQNLVILFKAVLSLSVLVRGLPQFVKHCSRPGCLTPLYPKVPNTSPTSVNSPSTLFALQCEDIQVDR